MPLLSTYLLVGLCVISTFASSIRSTHREDSAWQQYKTDFSKSYDSPELEARRRAIWKEESAKVEAHNERYLKGTESFEQGINAFSDFTWDEAKSIFLHEMAPSTLLRGRRAKQSHLMKSLRMRGGQSPASYDTRDFDFVTPIQNQGLCQAGWAFAAAGALEGQKAKETGCAAIPLSVQELIDCDTLSDGCNGGYPDFAIQYAAANGIASETDYPYTGARNTCLADDISALFTSILSSEYYFQAESQLKDDVYYYGPVAAGICVAPDFLRYRSGVYDSTECDKLLNHAVLVVGYGTDDAGTDFWLLKNSFGVEWGEQGYMRLKRNDGNLCGIGNYIAVAELEV